MTHIDHLDYELPPGNVFQFPGRNLPNGQADDTALRFVISGPETFKEVELFANELHQHIGVDVIETDADPSFNPHRIDFWVKLVSADEWRSGEYQNPENPEGDPVNLLEFVGGSLRKIAAASIEQPE